MKHGPDCVNLLPSAGVPGPGLGKASLELRVVIKARKLVDPDRERSVSWRRLFKPVSTQRGQTQILRATVETG